MRRCAAAAFGLAIFALPHMARADDPLKYEDLVHCAATNIVVASLLSLNDGEIKNKPEIEAARGQAASLMMVATLGSKKGVDVVQADVSKETDVLIGIISDKTTSDGFVKYDVPSCHKLGKAAVEVTNDAKSGK